MTLEMYAIYYEVHNVFIEFERVQGGKALRLFSSLLLERCFVQTSWCKAAPELGTSLDSFLEISDALVYEP